jgi:hypothetical protein
MSIENFIITVFCMVDDELKKHWGIIDCESEEDTPI